MIFTTKKKYLDKVTYNDGKCELFKIVKKKENNHIKEYYKKIGLLYYSIKNFKFEFKVENFKEISNANCFVYVSSKNPYDFEHERFIVKRNLDYFEIKKVNGTTENILLALFGKDDFDENRIID